MLGGHGRIRSRVDSAAPLLGQQERQQAFLTGGILYGDRSGGTVTASVLPETGKRYIEGLKTARYDLSGNRQWVFGGKYVLTSRFAASDQDHRHQYGEDIEKDSVAKTTPAAILLS